MALLKSRKKPLITLAVIVVVGLVGSALLVGSHAATPYVSQEAEAGTIKAPASKVSDTSASGSNAVRFMAATTTPTPTPTPPGNTGRACSPYPKFPDASCTGVDMSQCPNGLAASGEIVVTTANTTISCKNINGDFIVKAANVTLTNSKIRGSGTEQTAGMWVVSGNMILRNDDISNFGVVGVAYDNFAAYNVNLYGMHNDGFKIGSNSIVQDSYVHDFTRDADAHADGIQLQGGANNVTVKHNYINGGGTGKADTALFFAPDLGPNGNGPITITQNIFGAGNFIINFLDGGNGQYHQKGYAVTNNHFLRNSQYGPTYINEPAANFTAWCGNVYDDNGAAISGPINTSCQ